MNRRLALVAMLFLGAAAGAAAVIPFTSRQNYARGLELGRHEIRLEAIKAEAATMRNGRFIWTPAR